MLRTVPTSPEFQSTLPGWGATVASCLACTACSYFNPRSPDGERQETNFDSDSSRRISIHAPRMGSDRSRRTRPILPVDFNPRSPDGERPVDAVLVPDHDAISIHAPRMGSDPAIISMPLTQLIISIHAPRMGSDAPARNQRSKKGEISIHAPRMGSNPADRTWTWCSQYFNPRSPDGERQPVSPSASPLPPFQSTLPGWGSDLRALRSSSLLIISIHAPRMGSDT